MRGSTRGKGTRSKTAMMPSELRRRIERLRPAKEAREQLAGWLDEYDKPGFYGRRVFNHSAKFAYNHLQSARMILWLAQAVGTPRFALRRAKTVLRRAQAHTSSESAAVRSVLPWELIEALLRARDT